MPVNSFLDRIIWVITRLGGVKTAASALSIPVSTLSRIKNGESKVSHENLILIAQHGGIDMNWLISGIGKPDFGSEYIHIPIFDTQLTPGPANILDRTTVIGTVPFILERLQRRTNHTDGKRLALFEIKGNAMSPTIEDTDLVMVDLDDTLERDGIFAFCHNNQVRIKRLQYTFSGTNIMSDNTDNYDDEILTSAHSDTLDIIGRVIGRIGKL